MEAFIGIFREYQASLGVRELCRKHGVSDAAFYKCVPSFERWKCQRRRSLRVFEAEVSKPKKFLAEKIIDASTLQEMLATYASSMAAMHSCLYLRAPTQSRNVWRQSPTCHCWASTLPTS
ncbi:hypothetical protein [Roseibium sp.]|uniref:hypothetical protein n=1 Tax=Roseibium sp. TaxID=1936156 RepID=UPI003A9811B7